MLTTGIIFDYVWLHFCSLYPEARNLAVAYGENEIGKVAVSSSGYAFFEQQVPFPDSVSTITWQGAEIPVLFPMESNKLTTRNSDNSVQISTDIIAGAFYFLSGWQEFYTDERDRVGRFPYRESLQAKYNFIALPVVNYYFEILREALEMAYSITLKKVGWPKSEFVTFLSHDVDRLESAWKVEGKRQLKEGRIGNFLKLAWQKATGKDHWHNLETVAQTVKNLGAVSTFFWLPENKNYQQYPNADYDIADPTFKNLLTNLEAQGFENGLHGSFGTSEELNQLQTELNKVPANVKGNRFHYLKLDPKTTFNLLDTAGFEYDATLGFAEHFGFRNGYSFPFRPFDFSNLKPYPFLEIPLNLMDATLWHPNYLQLNSNEIVPAIKPMLREINKFGGCFGLLWHNENFSELNTKNGLAAFVTIMEELQQMQSGFLTGAQISAHFKLLLQ